MKQYYTHNNNNREGEPEGFFSKLEVPYGKSRGQSWAELEARMAKAPPAKVVSLLRPRLLVAAAVLLFLLSTVALVMRFYTITVESTAGEHLTFVLPDGTVVDLNARSGLSYHPFWWKMERSIRFEGEGYFQVEEGGQFLVRSGNGATRVLGTSFHIYSRSEEYRVTCFTGTVKVTSPTGQEALLGPEYKARVSPDGNVVVTMEGNPEETIRWMNGMFSFVAQPLRLVLDEIERQYGIIIEFDAADSYQYTGYFSRETPLEEALELVCKPFGLNFARKSGMIFEVYPN